MRAFAFQALAQLLVGLSHMLAQDVAAGSLVLAEVARRGRWPHGSQSESRQKRRRKMTPHSRHSWKRAADTRSGRTLPTQSDARMRSEPDPNLDDPIYTGPNCHATSWKKRVIRPQTAHRSAV